VKKIWSICAARVLPVVLGAALLVSGPVDTTSAGSVTQGRLSVCGVSLCRSGHTWQLYLAAVYGGLDNPAGTVAQAKAVGLNAIRITDFLDTNASPSAGPLDESRWVKVDRLIAAASAAHLLVELDFSTYRNLLQNAGKNPYTVDWHPFLASVANRYNTVTGIRYGNDPTIGLVSFAGEVDAINGGGNTYGLTAASLLAFYRNVLAYWHHLAPNQLDTAGGLYQLDWNSGIPWQAIFRLPYNDVNALHVYGPGDRSTTVPMVSAFSKAGNEPWIIEEFGFDSSLGDSARAAGFAGTFALARQYGAAGTGFWNLGTQTIDTHDVGPQFPQLMAVVKAHPSGYFAR